MGRRANIILISSAAAILLVCVVIVVRAIGGFIGGSSVADEIAKLKAKGEPVSISEIVPPEVPDSRNAALVYAKAFKLLPNMDADPQLRKLDEFVADRGNRKGPKEWEAARIAVSRCTAAMQVAEAASTMPDCRFEVDWDRGWQAEMPHLRYLRRLSTAAAAKALTEAKAGHTQRALDAARLGIRIGESLRREPGMICYFARLGCIRTAISSLDEIISGHAISEQQARGLEGELARIELIHSGTRALQTERTLTIAMYESLPKMAEESFSKGRGGRNGGLSAPAGSMVVKTFMRREEAAYLRAMTRYVENAELPYRRIARDRTEQGAKKPERGEWGTSGMLAPTRQFQRVRDDGATALAGARILLALRLYRQRVGSYPRNLDEIGQKLPADTFSGRGFGYKQQGTGCLLYSIGPDLKDDGGVKPELRGNRVLDVPRGDIVWRLLD